LLTELPKIYRKPRDDKPCFLYVTPMKTSEAMALIERAVRGRNGTWADLGAGDGTFTRALVELLSAGSRIYAVDQDASAVDALSRLSVPAAAHVTAVRADITRPFALPDLGDSLLDGILLANALHFVRDADLVLRRLVTTLRPGGRVVFVEYDQRAASRWVPYPIARSRLPDLAAAVGLSRPEVIATRTSRYSGILYAAMADRS
jgi:SAM-dependent methyltransferase